MHAAGQRQHAGEIAAGVRQGHLGIERPARTLERETFRLVFSMAGLDVGRPRCRVDAVVAQDTPEAGRDVEIGIAPGMDDHGKLASGLAVEDRDQPLVGVPLNGAFGGDPFGTAVPAGAVRTVRDIKDHGIDRRTDAADCRPVRILGLRATGRDEADQCSENGSA